MSEKTQNDLRDAARLRDAGIQDAETGLRRLRGLAGQGVTDNDVASLIPLLLKALRDCPEPDRALGSFARWFEAVSGRASYLQLLLQHPIALNVFCLVAGSSLYFADLLARNPEYFEIIANPGMRGGRVSAAAQYRAASGLINACHNLPLKKDVLRRWKAREMLRIGVRDLAGLADMPTTAREFSNLADACVQCALDIAFSASPLFSGAFVPPLAVVGMGKLGGQELNYSSDIDLMFVHGDNLPENVERTDGRKVETAVYLTRIAEAVVKILAEETANGHVFRVDMRLRPEGRFGALTRSLAGFAAYYESWAENWERQAGLKARFLAGDRALGEAFMALLTPFAYRPVVSAQFVQDILENKRRIERACELEGETETNIKTGYGGIRDIEFIAQKFQLIYGGRRPNLRTTNTLAALFRLRRNRLLTDAQAAELSEAYQYLRNLEHRLQLLQGFQTQNMPRRDDLRERAWLARRMEQTNPIVFEAELTTRRSRVHAHLRTLFYGETSVNEANAEVQQDAKTGAEIADLLDAIETPAAQSKLEDRLRDIGFQNLPAALLTLRSPMRGSEWGEMPPDTAAEFKSIAPRLLELLADAPDPDAALAGLEALAFAVPNRAQLYAALDDSPEMLAKVLSLGSIAPPLIKQLARHLEWLDGLLDAEGTEADAESTPTESDKTPRAELQKRVNSAKDFAAKLDAIALFHQRETLRIGARDIWEERDTLGVMSDLTRLAEITLAALLEICIEALAALQEEPKQARATLNRVAIIGLGKLGGAELGYGSDWDVVFVYDAGHDRADSTRSDERFGLVNKLAERIIGLNRELALRGVSIEIDPRLRPWGRQGALVHSLRGAIAYYRESGETWERQAALKARYIAGNPEVGRRFERILHSVSFGRGVTPEENAAIAAMKNRIETERLKPAERDTDLKLGHGGLSDMEWLVQRLQLRHGGKRIPLRVPNTLRALSALVAVRQLDNAEADALTAAYLLLTRLRNALVLQTGVSANVLPADPIRRRVLARFLGYADETQLWNDLHAAMTETRRIFLLRFKGQ